MPPREILGGGNSSWENNQDQSQASVPWNPTSDTTEGYQFEVDNASGYWTEPSAANRSDESLAPSVACRNQTHEDANKVQLHQQRYQRLPSSQSPVPGHTPVSSDVGEGFVAPTSPWLDFLQSYPLKTNPIPPAISGASHFRDGNVAAAEGDLLEVFSSPGPVSRLKPGIQSARRRKATADLITNPPRKDASNMPAHAPIEGSSTALKSPSGTRTRQSQPTPRKVMTRSGLSQREDEAQNELHVPNQNESQASSSHSVNSRASFDFSKLDRLDQALQEPGIVRYGPSSASQSDGRSLPDEKGFSIQIGSELFKLSGASIMSDAPSYFSAFFTEQLRQNDDRTGGVRTLFIDRDPETFRDIARHLQGYFIVPLDGRHFVRLFADAQFYRLPRLQSQLFESEIFVEVGDRHFRIPRDIFSAPGDTPNYFTLGFTIFFSSPGDVFPGLNPRGLLRPPAIHPPRIPNRSPESFADLLHILRGYPLSIRNDDHRNQLLRDARYYNLRGLEQRLIPHTVTHNPNYACSEATVRLQDIKPSQISLVNTPPSSKTPINDTGTLYVRYARPFIPEPSHLLIVELSTPDEPLVLDCQDMRVGLLGSTRTRMTALLQTIANKLNLPTTIPLGLMMTEGGASSKDKGPASTGLSEERVKVEVSAETDVVVDGKPRRWQDKGGDDMGAAGVSNASERAMIDDEVEGEDESDYGGEDWSSRLNDAGNVSKRSRPSPSPSMLEAHVRKRRRKGSKSETVPSLWTVNKSQWRLKVQPKPNSDGVRGSNLEVVLIAVKMEAISGETAKNKGRVFLSS
ncbi:MAG: hypothetical protein Q9222_002430 [Ikaeria aurantiellina]